MKWGSREDGSSASIMRLPFSINVLLFGCFKLSRTFYNNMFNKPNKSGYHNEDYYLRFQLLHHSPGVMLSYKTAQQSPGH